jgi:hypothetical protein
MAKVVIDIAAEYTGNKAFKQAETATQKLEKSVGKLGKQLLGVFAASKVLAFGKASVKAFAADEKAARSLSLALANTGNAFAGIEVEKFIADLQRTTGVLDDNLRPAFRTLLTATGDVKKSQDGLALALDIAAGTGKDLGAVSMALSKAYGGQTTALSRLGAGLDKATLASGDMDLITGELTKKFKGQALAAAEGYSGQMDRLAVASANAKEIIGKDLLDSLALLSGPGGISKSTTQMENLATAIGDVVYGLATLIDKVKSIPGANAILGTFGDVLSNLQPFAGLRSLGGNAKAAAAGKASPGGAGAAAARLKYDKEQIKLQKTKNSLSKIDNDNTTRKLALTGDQLALLELEKNFDVERIGLFAALNQATDEETRMRLLSKIAIYDQNEALAGLISKTNLLSSSLYHLSAEFAMEAERMRRGREEVLAGNAGAATNSGLGQVSTNPAGGNNFLTAAKAALLSPSAGNDMEAARMAIGRLEASRSTNVTVNIAGSLVGQRDLQDAVVQAVNAASSSGTGPGFSRIS